MLVRPLLFLRGVATFVPGLDRLASRETGGTVSARYCYSVWLRHLAMAYKNGLSTQPEVVAELGPGDSLGIGLAALMSGANKYYALDVLAYANNARNMEVFNELLGLFRNHEDIPGETEFPNVKPYLDTYSFPHHILTTERLRHALNQDRISSIRNALQNPDQGGDGIEISYFAPWYDSKTIEAESIDMVYSQATLEHVDDLRRTYEALYLWLKPGGLMSHQIDFKCHGISSVWNGHWALSDFAWKLLRGKRRYLLNRQPHSAHISLLRESNFEVVCDMTFETNSGIERKSLAPRFRELSDEDLTTSGVFIQAVKR